MTTPTQTLTTRPKTPDIDTFSFSLQEILQALALLKKGNATGPDRLPLKLSEMLDTRNLHIVLDEINEAFSK